MSDTQTTSRNIIICSDGTGNAGGRTRGTNVWRIYKELDRHNSKIEQLAYYDDGVGTDNLRFLKIIGGAFGWGLSRNLIDLYSFAASHYRPGDRLYLFGFSRGAYTVRALGEMILKCGLLKSDRYRTERHPHCVNGVPHADELDLDILVEPVRVTLAKLSDLFVAFPLVGP